MKASPSVALVALLSLASVPVFAFDLNSAAQAYSALKGGQAGDDKTSQVLGLVQSLSALPITPLQMLGGTGALLGLAQSQLTGSDYAQLSESVPGIEKLTGDNALDQLGALGGLGAGLGGLGGGLGGLLGKSVGPSAEQSAQLEETGELLDNVQSMQDVNQAFSAMGMDAGLAGQFAPILLQFLGNQGVAAPLVQSLAGIWGVSGAGVVPGTATGGGTGSVPATAPATGVGGAGS
ncbi:DUF2780 domain-containing protein [Azotobacter vinelandii]|uniref:DUF2780 domain-containing protein n=1 Tax=Azotobacter vinelandii TaxID=354 RepID=UPI000774C965|nr:DUF2780 domain-containing protein [Azotobacter vinelandii]